MNLTLEFDITDLHSFERTMFPFDEYDSEIRLIFPVSDNVVLRAYVSKCETEDKTINILYPCTRLQRELNVKDPNEMEYGGIIYFDFFAVEKWQWVSVNVKFDTDVSYHFSAFLPFDAFLILMLVMGFSPVLLKKSSDRILCIVAIGTAAILVLLTSLINYNQLLPAEVSRSLGHFFITLGFIIFATNFSGCLVFAKREVTGALPLSISMVGIFFLFYAIISTYKILWHLSLVSLSALPISLYYVMFHVVPWLRKALRNRRK